MRSITNTLMQVMAIIFSVLFAMSLAMSLTLIVLEQKLFDPATYKAALQNQGVYENMPSIMAGQVYTNLSNMPQGSLYLQFLSEKDWEVIINGLVSSQDIQDIGNHTIDSLVGFLNGKNNNPIIFMTPLKKSLIDRSDEAVTRLESILPVCSGEQLSRIIADLTAGQATGGNILCSLPKEVMALARPLVTSVMKSEISALPESISLFDPVPMKMRDQILNTRAVVKATLFLPIALLTFLTLFAVRSFTGWLKWWGMPVTLAGLLTLGTALASGSVASQMIIAGAERYGAFAAQLATTGSDIIDAIFQVATGPLVTWSIFMIAVGLLMSVVGFVLDMRFRRTGHDYSGFPPME